MKHGMKYEELAEYLGLSSLFHKHTDTKEKRAHKQGTRFRDKGDCSVRGEEFQTGRLGGAGSANPGPRESAAHRPQVGLPDRSGEGPASPQTHRDPLPGRDPARALRCGLLSSTGGSPCAFHSPHEYFPPTKTQSNNKTVPVVRCMRVLCASVHTRACVHAYMFCVIAR